MISEKKGQAMILATLTLGGTILGVTTIAGLLMTYQIRQTTNLENSAKAIFAADAGIQCGLYNFFQAPPTPCPTTLTLPNGAIYIEATNGTSSIDSEGDAGTARRAFFLDLSNATTTAG